MKTKRHPIVWIIPALAFLEGGWLAFDGGHALLTGDYVTPSGGPYAGKLGPWSGIVSAIGLEPKSTLVMSIHLILGSAWLVVMAGFLRGLRWSREGMLVCAFLGLWYLPFGTIFSSAQIVLLLLPAAHDSGKPA